MSTTTLCESEVFTSARLVASDCKLPPDDKYGEYYPTDPKNLKLESNFGPMLPEKIGYLQPTSKDTPIEVMRERLIRDGYLFVSLSLSSFGSHTNPNLGQESAPTGPSAGMPQELFLLHGALWSSQRRNRPRRWNLQ